LRLDVGLFQSQVQKQILSPQMIQSMEILCLNSQQLEERIESALEENIALELAEDSEGESAKDSGIAGEDKEVESSEGGDAELKQLEERYEHLADYQADDYYSDPGRTSSRSGSIDDDDRFEALQNAEGRPETLQEYLVTQLRLKSKLPPRLLALSEEVIFSIDSRGFLLYPVAEIVAGLQQQLEGVEPDPRLSPPPTLEEVTVALQLVRSLDPPGVGATDLGECLILQLELDPGDYPFEISLIREHLGDIAKNRLPQIAKATGHSIPEVQEAIEIIRALNPIPGRAFESSRTSAVTPDVIIDEDENGELQVQVSGGRIPKVRVSPLYRELLKQSRKDPEVRKYLRTRIENAEWLLSAIHQRQSTLQRVAEEVVKHQEDFFRKGDRFLRPLKMQDIAEKIGVNVSTVSRAIAGKFFQAPGMVRDLRGLFTGGTVRDDGAEESRAGIIARIQDLLEGEDKKKPLSDSKIVLLLAKSGIHISRRTVTKYREAEGIPSSRERRTF